MTVADLKELLKHYSDDSDVMVLFDYELTAHHVAEITYDNDAIYLCVEEEDGI